MMIISHKHKYLFIEVPRTGTTTISDILCRHYDGERILRKHSSYWNFLVKMKPEWKEYIVFSSICNPMDSVVSLYFKLRNSQKNPFRDSPTLGLTVGNAYFRKRYLFAQDKSNSFSDYFLKFYKRPYHDMTVSHDSIDFVMRFENMKKDFDEFLSMINFEKVRDLPILNRTHEKSRDFLSYYDEKTWNRAFRVFAPYFNKWNYRFPESWNYHNTKIIDEIKWQFSKPVVRTFYYLLYRGSE